jgi:hypothetical protein
MSHASLDQKIEEIGAGTGARPVPAISELLLIHVRWRASGSNAAALRQQLWSHARRSGRSGSMPCSCAADRRRRRQLVRCSRRRNRRWHQRRELHAFRRDWGRRCLWLGSWLRPPQVRSGGCGLVYEPKAPPPRLSAVMRSPSLSRVARATSKVVSQCWPLVHRFHETNHMRRIQFC